MTSQNTYPIKAICFCKRRKALGEIERHRAGLDHARPRDERKFTVAENDSFINAYLLH